MTKYIYKGNGTAFIQGVPARDLTADDFAALTPDQQKDVARSGLYTKEGDAPKEAKPVKKQE